MDESHVYMQPSDDTLVLLYTHFPGVSSQAMERFISEV